MAFTKIQTGVRFEEEMLLKMVHISKKNRRSLNAQLEFLAQQCIEDFEREHGEIPVSEDNRYRR